MSWGPGHKWINWGVQLEDLEAHGWPSRHLQTNFRTCWSGNIMMLAFQIVCKQGGSTYSRTAQMSWCLMFIRKRLHETAMSIWNIHKYYGNGYINGYCPMSIKPLSKLNTSMPAILLPQVPRSQHQDNLLPQRSSEGPPVAAWWAVRACHYINVYQNSKVDTFKMFKAENPWDLDTWSCCENSAGLI